MSVLEARKLENAPLTQKQIADKLGVSRQLVGFALRGQGNMTDGVRRQILTLAEEMGYDEHSNGEARALAARRYGKRIATNVIAVLFFSAFDEQPLSNVPFFVPYFQGLEEEASRRGLDLMLCPIRPGELPRLISARQVDGVVCLLAPHEVSRQVNELQVPVIAIQSDVRGVARLLIDDAGGMAQAVSHLAELGHRDIAYIGYGSQSGAKRFTSLKRNLKKKGLPYREEMVDAALPEPNSEAGAEGMARLLERCGGRKFSALICYNDLMAMGAMGVLQSAGHHVPDDVSVVGFDDVSAQYGFSPTLTSVSFSRRQLGRRAVELLFQNANAKNGEQKISGETCEIFPTELALHDSTRVFP